MQREITDSKKIVRQLSSRHRFCVIFGLVVISFYSLSILYGSSSLPSRVIVSNFFIDPAINLSEFRPFNGGGVHSFWNVCIEPTNELIQHSIKYYGDGNLVYNETQRIVVYNFKGNWTGKKSLNVAVSPRAHINSWDIYFTNESIPDTHTYQQNTAFFVIQFCPVNLYHFWEDEFVRLYCVVKKTNKLHANERNQILYRQPYHLMWGVSKLCWNYTRYQDILRALYTEQFHGVFFNVKPYTCFSSAVFGTSGVGTWSQREVINRVLESFDIEIYNASIGSSTTRYVTFINRSERRIINIEELSEAAKAAGIQNVRVVDFEEMSVKSQVKTAATSRIMIGVQGAGLQWAIFMPPQSTLVEVAWPKRYWYFYYSHIVHPYGIKHVEVEVESQNVFVNWTTFENLVRFGKPVPEAERSKMLVSSPENGWKHENLWKHADVKVNKTLIVEKLLQINN